MLPITPFLPQINDSLAKHNSLVLQAEPGAGKSTALPLSLINASWLNGKKIVMLEPRRVAAKSIACYLARQLGEQVGGRVGYQVKNDRKISTHTVLEIVTEGILTRRLQNDPELNGVGLIILDEFHERSLHTDLALMLSREVQQSLREDLKILVMSATIDTQAISSYLDNAPVIECPGRLFPVSVEYLPGNATQDKPLSLKIMSALKVVLASDKPGDILVFLPGQSDIKRCVSEAQTTFPDAPDLLFLPLYGGLSIEQQELALQVDPEGRRRVVFTTNIAETSLTIEGVSWVIDSGLEKVPVYDPQSDMTRLETRYISKASAEQRKGRAGRLQEGACLRLWSESRQQTLREFQGEEILSADLASLALDLCAWGVTDLTSFDWLTAPPKVHLESATRLLFSLGLIDRSVVGPDSGTQRLKITPLGTRASQLGLHPRLAAMLLQANNPPETSIACELAALLSENDIFHHRNSVDIVERLLALQDYKAHKKAALQTWPIKSAIAEQVLGSARSLQASLNLSRKNACYSLSELQEYVGRLLLLAYPDRLAKQRAENSGRYLLANGRGVQLFETDPLFGAEWLVVSDCDAQKKEGQIFSAASLSLETIHSCLAAEVTETDEYRLDAKKQNIIGRRRSCFGAITLREQALTDIPADAFQTCLHSLLRTEGLSILSWTQPCEDWLARASWLAGVMDDFPLLTHESLLQHAEQWLIPYLPNIGSIGQLKKLDILALLKGCLSWEQQQLLDKEAPETYLTPSDKRVPITYDKQQGPTVSVRLQEMFGELESPRLGGGKVALRFELLSPALRPLQTTSDLAHFWNNSYYEIAKEMRGRYPRHRWPEQPLLEKPGHSIKHPRR